MWEGYKNFNHFFKFSELNNFFNEVGTLQLIKKGRSWFYNVPASFDIEVSSFYEKGQKRATMYLWGFNLNGSSIYGRTWKEFRIFTSQLVNRYQITKNRRLIIYVHNLGYEFQFIRKHFKWSNVFSIRERRPIYAITEEGIEFRCSYILSNYALAYIGDNLLNKYKVTKAVGDLDYDKIRHSKTILTEKEIGYQIRDVQVVASFIQEKIEQDGNIAEIPLTNTGYVRNFCRNRVLGSSRKEKLAYRALMKSLVITSEQEYDQLKKAFSGGFTHASCIKSNEVQYNVGSADRTSAYPYAMVAEYFPMSKSCFHGNISEKKAREFMSKYCCIFTVVFRGLRSKIDYEHYISLSKCSNISNDYIVDNGRIVEADFLQMTITELDFDIIENVYEYDEIEFHCFRTYIRGYLPRALILAILDLYENKTSLKGIDDKVIEYMVSKNMINAAFGMAVTDIVRPEFIYEDGWSKEPADKDSQLSSYNDSFNRFLFYAWGVWVTAHSRHYLWDGILEFKEDYIYSDTDSIKGLNFDYHMKWFEFSNAKHIIKLQAMCSHYSIPFEKCSPKTKKGVTKCIGLWEIEDSYKRFKTIGAKRYIYQYSSSDELTFTVSGVNKKFAMPYLLYRFGGAKYHNDEWLKIFKKAYSDIKEENREAMDKVIWEYRNSQLDYDNVIKQFRNNMWIPPEFTGKMTMAYIDNPTSGIVTDYNGVSNMYTELSSTHAEKQDYTMSLSESYEKFLKGIEDGSM